MFIPNANAKAFGSSLLKMLGLEKSTRLSNRWKPSLEVHVSTAPITLPFISRFHNPVKSFWTTTLRSRSRTLLKEGNTSGIKTQMVKCRSVSWISNSLQLESGTEITRQPFQII
jgi:hypothetical protein